MDQVLFDLISLNFNFDNDKGTSYNCIASTAILCTSHFTPLHLVAKQSVSISPFHSLPMYFISSHLIPPFTYSLTSETLLPHPSFHPFQCLSSKSSSPIFNLCSRFHPSTHQQPIHKKTPNTPTKTILPSHPSQPISKSFLVLPTQPKTR